MIEQQPDNALVLEQVWSITEELRQKIEARFEFHPEPTTQDLQKFSSPDGNVKGSLNALRDLFLRRTSAERDPGNPLAAQMFGAQLTDKLVRALWGGDRTPTANG